MFAVGIWLFIGLPALVIVLIGECMPGYVPESANCEADRILQLYLVLFGAPWLAAGVGWIMYRYSKFLG